MKYPDDLIRLFRATERPESVAVLMVDDKSGADATGWDAELVRLLGAWTNADVGWEQPDAPCPDAGKPTARAWAWLWRGARVDEVELASAAGVSRAAARHKLAMLRGARLIYPDGSITQHAHAVIQAQIARRLKRAMRKNDAPPAPPAPPKGTN